MATQVAISMGFLLRIFIYLFCSHNEKANGTLLGAWNGIVIHQSWIEDSVLDPVILIQLIIGSCFDLTYRGCLAKSIGLILGSVLGLLVADFAHIMSEVDQSARHPKLPSTYLRKRIADQLSDLSGISTLDYAPFMTSSPHKSKYRNVDTTKKGASRRREISSLPEALVPSHDPLSSIFSSPLGIYIQPPSAASRYSSTITDDAQSKRALTFAASSTPTPDADEPLKRPIASNFAPVPLISDRVPTAQFVVVRSAGTTPRARDIFLPQSSNRAVEGDQVSTPPHPVRVEVQEGDSGDTDSPGGSRTPSLRDHTVLPTSPVPIRSGEGWLLGEQYRRGNNEPENVISPPRFAPNPNHYAEHPFNAGGFGDFSFGRFTPPKSPDVRSIRTSSRIAPSVASTSRRRASNVDAEKSAPGEDAVRGAFASNSQAAGWPNFDVNPFGDSNVDVFPPATLEPDHQARRPADISEPSIVSTPTKQESILSGGPKTRVLLRAEQLRNAANKVEDRRKSLLGRRNRAIQETRYRDAFALNFEIEEAEKEAEKLHKRAERRYYQAHNFEPESGTVDVHRLKVKEAVRRVERALYEEQLKGGNRLKVIVGRGKHSQNGVPVLKFAITERMTKGHHLTVDFERKNPGVINVYL